MTDATADTRSPQRSSFLGRRFLLLLLVALGAVALAVLYVLGALSFTYSEGERAGYVKSFARRGWLCKTWEGEMVVAAIPGTLPEVFTFTVRSDETARAINERLGTPMRLHYRQHIGVPSSCFGESAYFVDGVEPAEGLTPTPTPTPPPTPAASPQASPTIAAQP
jgi:hypothetical protein